MRRRKTWKDMERHGRRMIHSLHWCVSSFGIGNSSQTSTLEKRRRHTRRDRTRILLKGCEMQRVSSISIRTNQMVSVFFARRDMSFDNDLKHQNSSFTRLSHSFSLQKEEI